MFDIAWGEFVVIGVVALIVIGPKELPGVLRAIGQWTTKIRRMASEFQGQFQEALREAEMADLKKEVDTLTDTAKGFTSQFEDPLNLKEATKWEPNPDGTTPGATASDAAAKPVDTPPASPAVTPDGYAPPESVASNPVVEQSSVPAAHPAGEHGMASTATEAGHPPPSVPPAAQPPLPEGSGQRVGDGGVHS
jgi:sec-independent protein translocase protein TatB